MRIPKKIKILGYTWKVLLTKNYNKDGGGSFNWRKKTIKINDKYGESEAILLHEIVEAIMLHNLVRYYGNEGNSEFRFMFNHTEFCKIVYDLFAVLKENNLLK
jgi:hypothetical protein